MQKNNYWIKSGLTNIFSSGLSVLFSFLTFYFLVRVLTKGDYGVWNLFLGVTSLIEVTRNGLTQEALIKFYAGGTEDEKKTITTSVFVINFITTVILSIGMLILAPYLSKSWNAPEMTYLFTIYIINFFISGILNMLYCIEQASFSFTGIFFANITRQLVMLVYPAYCYFTKSKLDLSILVYLQITSVILSTIIIFSYTKKHLKFSKKLDYHWIRKILSFGIFTFGISLSVILAGSIDQMMLGWFLSTAATGVFSVALRITSLTEIPTMAMATIVYPQLSKRISSEGNQSVKYMYEKSVGVILAMLIPTILVILIFSTPVLHFIADTKYNESLPLLKLTLITSLFGPFGRQAGTVFNSAGKAKLNFALVIISSTVVIIANFIMIKSYGIIGAALGSLIAVIINTSIVFYFLKKYFNINPLNTFIYAYKFYPEFYNQYIKSFLLKK